MAMIVAMGAMTSLLVLGGVAIDASVRTGTATNVDAMRKRSFELAEAGLQATQYRMNMLGPTDTTCIDGTSTPSSPGSAGSCSYTRSAGNGGSFTAYTTTPLSTGASCAGTDVVSSMSAIEQRCVTATATIGGVTRRVQARVASYDSAPVFPVVGLTSRTNVVMDGSASVNGTVGLNGVLDWTPGDPSVSNVVLGPSGSFKKDPWQTTPPITYRTPAQGPFVLPAVNPGSSPTTADGNARLTNGSDPLPPYGQVTWNPTTRKLVINYGLFQIGGAIYNFCDLEIKGDGNLQLRQGVRTAIYIDSPTRNPAADCPPGSGNFKISAGGKITQYNQGSTTDPTALQLYIVGNGTDINFTGATAFYGTIYAPTSKLILDNGSAIYGAAAANDILMSGDGDFFGDSRTANITTNGAKVFYRTAWRECTPKSSTTDATAAC